MTPSAADPVNFDDLPPASGSVPTEARVARRQSPTERPDRLPPHAPEAEQGVLGCALIAPQEAMPILLAKFTMGDEVFYDLRHQTIYAQLSQMFDNGKPIDALTLMQRLKDFEMLDEIGGIAYLNALQDATPSAANVAYYADIVEEKYLLRKMLTACAEGQIRVYESQDTVDAVLDQIERDVLAVRKMRGGSSEVGVRELVRQALEEIEKKFGSKGAITGLSTGFPDLDYYTDGLHPGEMTVLAALPSVGKTSLAMNIAENVVLNLKQPTGVFSLEMTSVSLVKRCLCSTARVNVRAVGDGKLLEEDLPRLVTAAGRMSASAIYFDDSSDLSIYQLRAKARRMVQQYGVKLFVIDYLQLLNAQGGSRRVENRQQEIADISNGIKSMSKELNVPVLALSQLTENQNGETRLRGSADIGQDADGVWMLKPPTKKEGEIEETERVAPIDLWIKKQRNGPRNVRVKLMFLKQFTRFESVSRAIDEETPYDPQQKFTD